MSLKKLFMIILLIVFIIIVAIIITNVNNKSIEKNNEITNTTNIEQTLKKSSGIVRKISQKAEADTNNMVEITDNFFIEQTNDVYLNLSDYIGKTIKIEGLIYSYKDSNGDICYAVVRNTPGCCGNDGLAGIDIRYFEDYPEENTWVEVVGVVGTDKIQGGEIPAIQVSTLNIKEEGVSFVTN